MTPHSRTVSVSAIALVAALVLAGCFSYHGPRPVADDFVGTWVHGDTQLVLDDDGSFALTAAPSYLRELTGEGWLQPAGPPWDDSGDWRLDEEVLEVGHQSVFVAYKGSELVLHYALATGTDNPHCFELVREGSSLEPRSPDACYLFSWTND